MFQEFFPSIHYQGVVQLKIFLFVTENTINDSLNKSFLQGSPQWVLIDFQEVVHVDELHIMFQGGFTGKECWIESAKEEDFVKVHSFFPEDINQIQVKEGKKQQQKTLMT